ncbi:MAG TPA: hypothetical protein PKN29_08075 [Candidatus Ozemobacteraceae bacterium]|nr:hypothetical protein [Candidatus Ozemobacteraceae bacterium]
MNKTHNATMMAILALTVLMFLPGYKKQSDSQFYPAPIARPNLAFYTNLSVSGLFNHDQAGNEAIKEIVGSVEVISLARSGSESISRATKAAAAELLNNQILSGNLKIREVFFYMRNAENYAMVLTGEFSPAAIADLIGRNRINATARGFSTLMNLAPAGRERLFLEFRNDAIIICPENIAGNVLSNIDAHTNLVSGEFPAFDRMVRSRPAMAAEISFENLQKNIGQRFLPGWLQAMKHLRLLAASRVAKLQLFIPDNTQRTAISGALKSRTGDIKSAIGIREDLELEEKGNSIFIETKADEAFEISVSRRTAAFLLHFFAAHRSKNMVLSAAGHD